MVARGGHGEELAGLKSAMPTLRSKAALIDISDMMASPHEPAMPARNSPPRT